ncbi:hypothetical protein ACN6LM_001983 [Streptomyces sp. SAS_281]|uniref:hypothetical protein n=1 Tax=Streptomyces sp. SAS_281 TaxID=3412744 RepID=UPI00403C0E31
MDAWHRANDARPRPERSAGGQKATQLQIEELTKVVGQLAEQVATLTARLDAMGEVDHQQTHGERAYHRFLANLPQARSTPTPWVLRETQSEKGYVYWLPQQPSYTAGFVTTFVEDVNAMTEKRKFLTRLRAYLNAAVNLEQAKEMRLPAGTDPSRHDQPVQQAEVDRYVLEMREHVRSYFTELAEGPSREAS